MSSKEALEIALEKDLDLVLMSPNADPPVCKIINYGKFKFEQAKKLKANYLKTVDKENKVIIIIDDDPVVLNEINDQCENVVLFKDTVLVD